MDAIQLKYFKTVYEEGSFARAAERLFISPQGLSKSIHKLESELGVPLFEVTPSGLTLTMYGHALLAHTHAYLQTHQRALDEIRLLREDAGNQLTIGVKAGFSDGFGRNFLGNFIIGSPDLRIQVRSYSHSLLKEAMAEPGIPVWLLPGPYDKNMYRSVYEHRVRLFLLAAATHPLAQKETVCLHDIEQYPRISLPHDIGQKTPLAAASGNAENSMSEFQLGPADRELTMRLVASGRAVSFHSGWYYQDYPEIKRIEIADLNVVLSANILVRKDACPCLALNRFLNYVTETLPKDESR